MINTILVIAEQTMLHLPLMCGAYIGFSLLKVPDLSIESAYVVGAIFGATGVACMHAMPLVCTVPVVIVASLIGGACVGITSSSITKLAHLPHLLSSIITFGLFHGINQLISESYVSLSHTYNPLTILPSANTHPELATLVAIGCAVATICFLFFTTQLGYAWAVYGTNPSFFENYTIDNRYVFITGIVLSNALAGLSGYLFAQSNNFVEINMGLGKALLCITALILGKSLKATQNIFSIAVPCVGTVAYFSLQQCLLKVGFNLKYFTAMQALIVLLILIYTYRTTTHRPIDNLGV